MTFSVTTSVKKIIVCGISFTLLNGSITLADSSSENTKKNISSEYFLAPGLAPELHAGFNQQITSELDGAHIYLDIANYFYQKSLDGFGKWFTAQYYEEVNHARRLAQFLSAKNIDATFSAVAAPALNKNSPLQILQDSLALEEAQTKKIHSLFALSTSLNQYDASSFLKFYLDEQVQEEDMFRKVMDKLAMLVGDGAGLLALDRELGGRSLPAPYMPSGD